MGKITLIIPDYLSTQQMVENVQESLVRSFYEANTRKAVSRVVLKKLVTARRKAEPTSKAFNNAIQELVTKGFVMQDKQSFKASPALKTYVEKNSKEAKAAQKKKEAEKKKAQAVKAKKGKASAKAKATKAKKSARPAKKAKSTAASKKPVAKKTAAKKSSTAAKKVTKAKKAVVSKKVVVKKTAKK